MIQKTRTRIENPFVWKQLRESFEKGSSVEVACLKAGITLDTFRKWWDQGLRDLQDIEAEFDWEKVEEGQEERGTVFAQFYWYLAPAIASTIERWVAAVENGTNDKQAKNLLTLMELMYPDIVGRRRKQEEKSVVPSDMPVNQLVSFIANILRDRQVVAEMIRHDEKGEISDALRFVIGTEKIFRGIEGKNEGMERP